MALALSQQAHACLEWRPMEKLITFVDISYKFTLAWVFFSHACTRITINTCISDKKICTLYTDSVLYDEGLHIQ